MDGGVVTSAQERAEGSQALLQVPSGRIAYRVPLPAGEPWELEHEGYCWRWSHRCRSGVAYMRGRQVVVSDGVDTR
jgi:hypothetical protein